MPHEKTCGIFSLHIYNKVKTTGKGHNHSVNVPYRQGDYGGKDIDVEADIALTCGNRCGTI